MNENFGKWWLGLAAALLQPGNERARFFRQGKHSGGRRGLRGELTGSMDKLDYVD